jgi:glycogen(starch) synthase
MYPPQHAGGYELAWQAVVRRAHDSGHAVRVLTTTYRADDCPEEDPDVHRTLRWYWDLERYEFPEFTLFDRLRVERHNAAELGRHLAEFRPDVVTWWSMGCMSLSVIDQVTKEGIPAVFVVHDDWLVYGWERDQWLWTWHGPRRGRLAPLARRLSGIATHFDIAEAGPFVFNSRYTLERAQEAGVRPDRARVIHPGIDERFLVAGAKVPWTWRLGYVGRIDRQKGIDTAVSALAHLPPETTLTIWGTGDQEYITELESLAERIGAGGRIRFEGFAKSDVLRSAYESVDVVVFPVRWNEPFGLVPLEAMGMDRLVVTTARGGTAEFVINERNALVFDADDPAALAACVTRLAGDEGLRRRLREGGRATAARHTSSQFARRTLDAILESVAGW